MVTIGLSDVPQRHLPRTARTSMRRRIALAVGLLLVVVNVAHARHPAVRLYTIRDGLPQAQITAVTQDAGGFLWVGTQTGGVARYDGSTWRPVSVAAGLPTASVTCFALSPAGTLYVGTGGGAARLVGERWQALPIDAEGGERFVADILAVSDSEVWLATRSGLWRWDGGPEPPRPVGVDPSLAGVRITSLARDDEGRIWAGTWKGLAAVEPGKEAVLAPVPGLPQKRVSKVAWVSGLGLVLALTGSPLQVGRPGAFQTPAGAPVPSDSVTTLYPSPAKRGCIWVGTQDRSVLRWCGESWERFTVPQEESVSGISVMLLDREGVLWMGTDDGLVKQAPSAFVTYDAEEGLPVDAAGYGMTETAEGSLWFAFQDLGVYRLPPGGKAERFGPAEGLGDAHPADVVADGDAVWVLTDLGLGRIENGRFRVVELPPEVPKSLRCGQAAAGGALYLGTFSRGLWLLQGGKARRIEEPVGLAIGGLSPGPNGSVWCAGEGWGAARLRDGVVELRLTTAEGLPSDQVAYVLEDSRGVLWAATDRGVWRRHPDGRTEVLAEPAELASGWVYWVAEDPAGDHWLGTNHGLFRELADGTWERYTHKDGLGDDECNEDAFLVDSHGRLILSTLGISEFVGSRQAVPSVSPPVYVDEVRLRGTTQTDTARATLSAGSGQVTFSFACPSFIDESETRFRYRLVGLTDEWAVTGFGERTTTYGGLRHGEYRFEVVAVTSDGRTSTQPATTLLTVTPRWWERRSARILAGLVALLAVLGGVRWRERRFAREQSRLESLVAQRTEELSTANRRLAELAVTDELTQLPNRRSVLDSLRQMVAYARRREDRLAVALIDVDRFKQVNDQLGHDAGDQVLRSVSSAMRHARREQDILGRYGGDEFLLLLPGADAEGAVRAGERLREAASAMNGEAIGRQVTISVGVATLAAADSTIETLIQRADAALYQAKAAGRDLVVVAGDP